MKTSEVLNGAADLIEVRGWVGTDGQGWEPDGTAPLCIEGAIKAAMGLDEYLTIGKVNTCPAGLAVREHLGLPQYQGVGDGLFRWNDMAVYVDGELVPARTASEVVEVLRAAAAVEQARESELIVEVAS